MSTEQERIETHRAAVMAWEHRIPAVLASPDAARGLALAIVSELLCIFGRGPFVDVLLDVATLHGEAIALSAGKMDLGDIRPRADLLGSRLFVRSALTWRWETRIPYEVCEALRRACEDERSLCGMHPETCGECRGTGVMHDPMQTGPWPCDQGVAPPILALLLHDAAALLTDLRADTSGLESLVREAERKRGAMTVEECLHACERENQKLRDAIEAVQRQRDAARDHVTRITSAFDALYDDALESAVSGHSTVQNELLETARKAVHP